MKTCTVNMLRIERVTMLKYSIAQKLLLTLIYLCRICNTNLHNERRLLVSQSTFEPQMRKMCLELKIALLFISNSAANCRI